MLINTEMELIERLLLMQLVAIARHVIEGLAAVEAAQALNGRDGLSGEALNGAAELPTGV